MVYFKMASDDSIDKLFEEELDTYQGEDSHPYIDFDKFLEHYRGELSRNTLVKYGRALKLVDFQPEEESPAPDCLEEGEQEKFDLSQLQSMWAKRKMKDVYGSDEEDRQKRDRKSYEVFLSLKKYLYSIGEAEKVKNLPEPEEFDNKKSGGSGNSNRNKVFLSQHQVEEMVEVAGDKMEVALKLLYFGGMRSFELLHLKPDWLEFKESRIEVEVPPEYAKGQRGNRESETLYLKKEFEDELQNYILKVHDCGGRDYKEFLQETSEEEQEYLFNFIDDSSKTWTELKTERWRLFDKIRSLAEKAGLNETKISAHDFRRSQINRVYRESKDLQKTSLVARHGSTAVTESYIQRDEAEKWNTWKETFGD